MGRVHEKPVGPHPDWSCQLAFGPDKFADVMTWLALNRQGLIVFVHPETGNALADLVPQIMVNGDEVIKGQNAFAQWSTAWYGNLTSMEPGEGYRLSLDNNLVLPGTFTYPVLDSSAATCTDTTVTAAFPPPLTVDAGSAPS